MNAGELVSRLRSRVLRELEAVVPRGSRVALLDFPNHENVGDTAIWLGELQAARELEYEVAYVASGGSYSARMLRSRLGRGGVVLLHGGGNFGDLWPTFHAFRLRVLEAETARHVVQLPQTIHFDGEEGLRHTAAVIRRHPRFTLMVRDPQSAEIARTRIGIESVLAPDMAFTLGSIAAPAGDGMLVLGRTDLEASADGWGPVDRRDWLVAPPGAALLRHVSRAVAYPLKRVPLPLAPIDDLERRLFGVLARRRLARGLDLLASGRVVVTDRLHGHILCLLLGRPHVLVENRYGKLRRFGEEWTAESEITHWASGQAEAVALGRALLDAPEEPARAEPSPTR